MTHEDNEDSLAEQPTSELNPSIVNKIGANKIGAAGGAVAGATLGKSVGGRLGAVVGGVAGAVAGGKAAGAISDLAEEVSETLGLGIGADDKEVELPSHYTWEELQALSKPQGK
jgi:outer membrane lipoprotein SlyB